ncbi:hypothetical protein SEA_LILHUDDY_76 [Arthrobacter phage LilHuddy]|nr:hypothetical protein SEA_LILHUDDY_76 [Arthrobacter phage LilHuddy]
MDYITIECMNRKPHEAHSWREGFLWHRKRECGGVPKKVDHIGNLLIDYCKADVEATTALYMELFHRHDFRYAPEESDRVTMTWECRSCFARYQKFRSVYRIETLWRGIGNGPTVTYKKQKI